RTVNLNLEGSKFTNFAGTGTGYNGFTTANIIYARGNNAVVNVDGGVAGVTFSKNRGTGDAAGVAFSDDDARINFLGKVTFDSNWTGNYGGAVSVANAFLNFKGDTTFKNNYAQVFGGAMDIWGDPGAVVFEKPAHFLGNYIYATEVLSTAYPNAILDQHVRGGAINIGYLDPTATGTSLTFNDAVEFRNNYVINAKLAGNGTKNAYGGAFSVFGNGEAFKYIVTFNGAATFDGNYVYSVNGGVGHGGAVYYDSSAASLDIAGGSSFTNNYAKTLGGGIYLVRGNIRLNALTDNILFQGNRHGASFNNINPTYTPIANSGKPNAIYLGSSGTLDMNVSSGQKIEFYDPIASGSTVSVTITKLGDGETIFYGDN
ncbi:MAG: hypothetical protein ACRCWR_11690, partial [Saezia sp.]